MKKIILMVAAVLLSSALFAQDAVTSESLSESMIGEWNYELQEKKQTSVAKMIFNDDGTCYLYADINGKSTVDGEGTWKLSAKGKKFILVVNGKPFNNIKSMKPVVSVDGNTLTLDGLFFFGLPKQTVFTKAVEAEAEAE